MLCRSSIPKQPIVVLVRYKFNVEFTSFSHVQITNPTSLLEFAYLKTTAFNFEEDARKSPFWYR